MADNITYGLTAALLAHAGLRRRYGASATVALLVGSEIPDRDHYRGEGVPLQSAVPSLCTLRAL